MSRYSQTGRKDITTDARRLRPLLSALGGVDTYKAAVSADDTTPNYLEQKFTSADTSVVITVTDPGADEGLDLSVSVHVAAQIAAHTADADAHHPPVTLGAGNNAILALSGQELTLGDVATQAELDAHEGDANAHHNQSHVLATNAGLGADHTISGATSGHVLRASGATTAAFAQLQHSDLGGVSANQHHNQSHVLASTSGLGADHTVAGLTARQVLIATGASTALFRALEDADIPASIARDSEVTTAVSTHAADADAHHNWPLLDADIPSTIARDSEVTSAISTHASNADAHHNRSHAITSASDHTVTGIAMDVVGLTATNTLGILTPSSSPGAASAILKTDSNGYLVIQRLGVGITPAVPAHVSAAGNEMLRLSSTDDGSPYIGFYTSDEFRSYLQSNTNNDFRIASRYGAIELMTGTGGTAITRVTIDSSGNVALTGSMTVAGDMTINTNGNQGDRFLMANSNVSGGSVFYDFNQTDRDSGSTGAFEVGFYRDANNITQFRMSKEIFEIIIRDGGTYYFPLEVRGNQVILAELPTSNPGIVGALYRSGGTVLVST